MLKIINELIPFFEDCYNRIGVREYSRLTKISPPTASKILNNYFKEGLLLREEDRRYLLYHANKNNKTLIDLSRVYWEKKLKKLVEYLEKEFLDPTIILFGSLAKAETKKDSDIDIAIITPSNKKTDIKSFEKDLKRNIQLFIFKSIKDIKNIELSNNIINGYLLKGRVKL